MFSQSSSQLLPPIACLTFGSGANIGSWSASILPSTRPRQLSPKGNPMQSICPGLTALYVSSASSKEAALAAVHSAQPCARPAICNRLPYKSIPDAKLLCVPLVLCSKNRKYQHNAAPGTIHFSVVSTTSGGKVSHLGHNTLKVSCYYRPRYVPLPCTNFH